MVPQTGEVEKQKVSSLFSEAKRNTAASIRQVVKTSDFLTDLRPKSESFLAGKSFLWLLQQMTSNGVA